MKEEIEPVRRIILLLDDPENEDLQKELDEWRSVSPFNEELYQQIQLLWNISPELKQLDLINTEEAVARLSERMGYKPGRERKGAWSRPLSIAAAVLVLVLGYWIYSSSVGVNYVTKYTGDLVDTVVLPDGSRAYLADHTGIRYPEKNGKNREVFLLKGEAFFKVQEDRRHPFLVRVDSSTVTVLGTSFNIRSRPERIELSVKSGKVKFETPDGRETPALTAGTGIVYNRLTGVLDHYKDGSGSDFAWLTHELTFVDAPLSEVFRSLEKAYHIEVVVKDSLSSFSKFNADFRNNELGDILDILKETYPLSITRQGNQIIIRNK